MVGGIFMGSISGKFWFGVQGSDAGEKFGAEEFRDNWKAYFAGASVVNHEWIGDSQIFEQKDNKWFLVKLKSTLYLYLVY